MGTTILVLDPDVDARETAVDELTAETGYRILEADSIADAEEHLTTEPACVITEYDLPDGTGFDLFEQVREVAPDATCVLFTDADPDEVETEGRTVVEYVPKDDPEAFDVLADLVEHATAFRPQTAYPLPENEDERVKAVERYSEADDDLDDALDRLTELARGLFDVPMAVVGLVEEHEQRSLACRGIDLPTIDREDTVCTYAMLEDEVTVIEDLQGDPRFADDDGLRELGLRSYASANLVTPDGYAIGTFCLYDDEVREFDEADREYLELLADEAVDQLELRRRLAETEVSTDE